MMTQLISKTKIVLIILTIACLPLLSVTASAQNSASATARSIKEEVKKEREARIKALEEAKTERGTKQLFNESVPRCDGICRYQDDSKVIN